MTKEIKILYWVFLASLPACYVTTTPSAFALIALVFLQTMEVLRPKAKKELVVDDQAAALKTLGVLFKTMDDKVNELRSEVTGLNLRAGLGKH